MIIIIKEKNYQKLVMKSLSILSLFIMFYLYYGHMSEKFDQKTKELENKLEVVKDFKKQEKGFEYEQIIYKEAVTVVDLLDQKHVRSIKIVKDRLFIVCDYNTDIEPLLIRYGVKAFVKNTALNIKIAIDLKTIVENKYEV